MRGIAAAIRQPLNVKRNAIVCLRIIVESMEAIAEKVDEVAELIRRAAEQKRTVPFGALWSHFEGMDAEPADVYFTLEKACARLAARKEAIYEALMAKKDTQMPGSGFFALCKRHQPSTYKSIAGRTEPGKLTEDQKREITAIERKRVFAHASTP